MTSSMERLNPIAKQIAFVRSIDELLMGRHGSISEVCVKDNRWQNFPRPAGLALGKFLERTH